MPLSLKHAAFVREYLVDHNATQAAIRAGYSSKAARVTGHRLLTDAAIRQAIEAGEQKATAKAIATREQRQEFWTRFMLDEEAHPIARLKASELLGKSQADFVERHEHAGKDGGPLTIVFDAQERR